MMLQRQGGHAARAGCADWGGWQTRNRCLETAAGACLDAVLDAGW